MLLFAQRCYYITMQWIPSCEQYKDWYLVTSSLMYIHTLYIYHLYFTIAV